MLMSVTCVVVLLRSNSVIDIFVNAIFHFTYNYTNLYVYWSTIHLFEAKNAGKLTVNGS